MKRIYILLCIFGILSCQDKVICPAFQSTYILDDSTRNAYFSYVWQLDETTRSQFLAQQDTSSTNSAIDTTISVASNQPKVDYYAYAGENIVPWRIPERTKYGIVKPVFMPVKKYRMRTAPMENLLGPDPEPMQTSFVAQNEIDSLVTDSLELATTDSVSIHSFVVKEEEKDEPKFLYGYDPSDNFNVEQLYYNKYFASRLIDNRPEPEPQPVAVDSTSSDSTIAKKPFLKGLFGKKNKTQPADSLASEPDPVIESSEDEEENE